MENIKIIAFTHKLLDLSSLSQLFIADDQRNERLTTIKNKLACSELMYLATCNRIEFILVTNSSKELLITELLNELAPANREQIVEIAEYYEGEQAVEHIFKVASSLDSLVVGEREIITQVRKSYEECKSLGLSGDTIRILIKRTIETAKDVYTHTKIAHKSVSVVFLAYQRLRELTVKLDARVLFIGAGQTNQTMAKFLLSHGFRNFAVFNRTFGNAEKLATELKGTAHSLEELDSYKGGFDVIISCTGSSESVLTKERYAKLLSGDISHKVLVDLAIPYDIDREITTTANCHLIHIEDLQGLAELNRLDRESEVGEALQIIDSNVLAFERIFKERQVERALSEVPKRLTEIRDTALNSVFAKDIEGLDPKSKEVLDKVLNYLEKKYIAVPMVMAKEFIVGK